MELIPIKESEERSYRLMSIFSIIMYASLVNIIVQFINPKIFTEWYPNNSLFTQLVVDSPAGRLMLSPARGIIIFHSFIVITLLVACLILQIAMNRPWITLWQVIQNNTFSIGMMMLLQGLFALAGLVLGGSFNPISEDPDILLKRLHVLAVMGTEVKSLAVAEMINALSYLYLGYKIEIGVYTLLGALCLSHNYLRQLTYRKIIKSMNITIQTEIEQTKSEEEK